MPDIGKLEILWKKENDLEVVIPIPATILRKASITEARIAILVENRTITNLSMEIIRRTITIGNSSRKKKLKEQLLMKMKKKKIVTPKMKNLSLTHTPRSITKMFLNLSMMRMN
jgi:hypothetical protein